MAFDFQQQISLPKWNRILLNGYWGMVILSIALTVIYNVIATLYLKVQPARILGLYTLWAYGGLLIMEAANARLKRFADYIVILGGGLLAFCLISTYPQVSSTLTALFLPILASVFYFQRRKLVFSFFVSLITFYGTYLSTLKTLPFYGIRELLTMTGILAVGFALAFGIICRGAELLKHLRTTIASEQDLLVKNILMDKMAKTDALTGLYNHMSFHEHLDNLILQGERNGLTFQLALLDIDHFKKVNDSYGHRAGDAVLKKVAGILQDMVSLNDFPARYGGEEFAILFTDMSTDEALLHLEHIRRKIASLRHEELGGNPVTISIGLNTFEKGCLKEQLFAGADNALYRAKRQGRNRTEIYAQEAATLSS
ncbi:GGDEF domain-containing protein [Paenibacillus filicis]|uniref:GGDEF domain-containing protein n=1 Tax=Paenibacillus gyeongsangnamensis TaxID=3388067 RepID=A0ABT4QI11_9BACL|nr:GGDEF domain-containing protein [Paenibacillus filicis]MCZ8516526.1 GGDEF domain-containing protein [Paenibacillus filicis]